MVVEAQQWPEFRMHLDGVTDCIGRPSSPLALLILGTLRVLGRNAMFDDVAEATNISEEVHRNFFRKFVLRWSLSKYPELVRAPETEEEFRDNEQEYHRAGFTGCFASVDCVHVRWEAPYGSQNVYTGKEGYYYLLRTDIDVIEKF